MYSLEDVLTKEKVLQRFTQEEIFKKYLGIDIELGKLLRSPLRNDKNPTCSFYYNKNGVLYMRDFAGYFWGDCFSLVMKIENVGFYKALEKIYYNMSPSKTKPKITVHKDKSHTILVKKREWKELDLRYWEQYNIRQSLLDFYDVYPCQEVWISKNGRTKLYYSYSKNNPAYAYMFEPGDYKIYKPFVKEFYMKKGHLEGYNQLPQTGKTLLITKSYKDVMCLRSFGILSVAKSGESAILTKEIYKELSERFSNIYSFFDYDYAGIKAANQIKREFGVKPLFLPYKRLLFNKPDFGAKDISDFMKKYGFLKTCKLVNGFIENNYSFNDLYKTIMT